jgi:hypothetical protein
MSYFTPASAGPAQRVGAAHPQSLLCRRRAHLQSPESKSHPAGAHRKPVQPIRSRAVRVYRLERASTVLPLRGIYRLGTIKILDRFLVLAKMTINVSAREKSDWSGFKFDGPVEISESALGFANSHPGIMTTEVSPGIFRIICDPSIDDTKIPLRSERRSLSRAEISSSVVGCFTDSFVIVIIL